MTDKDAVRNLIDAKLKELQVPEELLTLDWTSTLQAEYEQFAAGDSTDQQIADNLLPYAAQWLMHMPVVDPVRDSQDEKALKIIFVGNSLTFENSLPNVVAELLEQSPDELGNALKIYQIINGGLTLENHWQFGVALDTLRNRGPWDYVVLQEQSTRSQQGEPQMFHYAQLFADEIKKEGAKILIYGTWTGHSLRSKQNQANLNERFSSIANITDGQVVPAGACWWHFQEKHRGVELYSDEIHPSPAGTYLAACAFYCVLTGKSPTSLITSGEVSKSLSNKDRILLAQTAALICLPEHAPA